MTKPKFTVLSKDKNYWTETEQILSYVAFVLEDVYSYVDNILNRLEDPTYDWFGGDLMAVDIEEQKVSIYMELDPVVSQDNYFIAEIDKSCFINMLQMLLKLKKEKVQSISFSCDDTYITMTGTFVDRPNYIKCFDYRIMYEKATMEYWSCEDISATNQIIPNLDCNLETSDVYLSNLCNFLINFHIDAILTLLQDQSIESLFYKANGCMALDICQNQVYIYAIVDKESEDDFALISRNCLTQIVKTWKELYKEGLQKVEIYRYVDTMVIVAQREGEPELRREFNYTV